MRITTISVVFLLLAAIATAHYTSSSSLEYQATVVLSQEPPSPNVTLPVFIRIENTSTGVAVTDLDLTHDRIMHVFIIDPDLAKLTHIHPEDFPNYSQPDPAGTFTVEHNFATPGTHALAIDYARNGVGGLKVLPIETSGNANAHPNLTLTRSGTFAGYHVTLNGPETIEMGNETEFMYHIERGGKNVTDLQQYIGSDMHVFLIRDDMKIAGHMHPYIPGMADHLMSMPQYYHGPNIPVHMTFSEAGTYVVFSQFQENGKVVQTRFVVNVTAPPGLPVPPEYVLAQNKPATPNQSWTYLLVLLGLAVLAVLVMRRKRR